MSSVYHPTDHDLEDLEYACKKFRICIIGRTGVGKSTLLARVFGFDDQEAGVSRSGERRGRHNIWQSFTNDQQNRALTIHDSGGFEAGEDNTLSDVERFIDYRGNQASLAEQLHCIWYCISLTDDRPIQMAEENFFGYFADKNVPLVFVFTKYDKLITTFFAEIFQTTGRMTAAELREAEQKAQEYVANIRDKLERAVGKGVTVQAVDDKNNERVNTLVKSTMNIVRPNLQGLLVRAQAVSASLKREECLSLLPNKFKPIIRDIAIPGYFLQGIMLGHRFGEMFRLCSLVWNVRGLDRLLLREDMIDRFKDAIHSEGLLIKMLAFTQPAGPLTAALYVRICIKMACDLMLIFQLLTARTKWLGDSELRKQLERYKTSRVKQTVHQLVDGKLGALDLRTAFDLKCVTDILRDVVETGARELEGELSPHRLDMERVRSDSGGFPLAELPP